MLKYTWEQEIMGVRREGQPALSTEMFSNINVDATVKEPSSWPNSNSSQTTTRN